MKSFKHVMVATFLSCLAFLPHVNLAHADAQESVRVEFNGREMQVGIRPYTTSAFVEDGRTYLPARAIFQAAGFRVAYNPDTREITAIRPDHRIVMRIGSTVAQVDGRDRTLDAPPKIVGDRTMVPLRSVMEALGGYVEWNHASFTASVLYHDVKPLFPFSKADISNLQYDTTESVNSIGGLWYRTPTQERYIYFPNTNGFNAWMNAIPGWGKVGAFFAKNCIGERVASVASGDGHFFVMTDGYQSGWQVGTAMNGYWGFEIGKCMQDQGENFWYRWDKVMGALGDVSEIVGGGTTIRK